MTVKDDGTTPPEGTGTTSQVDDAGSTTDDQDVTLATPAELQRARSDAAKYRNQLRETQEKLKGLEKSQKEADDAKKSELERLTERTSALENEVSKRDSRVKALSLEAAVLKKANSLGIVDPDAAWRLLDAESVEYDGDGKPTNIDDLLKDLMEARPYLKGKATTGDTSRKDSTSTTQPDSSKKRPLTIEDVNRMSDDEINANWDEVQKVLTASGR